MRIWCVIFVSVGALSGVLLKPVDGVCSDAVKYVSREELGSATIINRCDQYGNICSKEEQTICTAQWRRMDGSSNSEWKSAYIDPNNRTHYQFLTSQRVQGEFDILHTYVYVCGVPSMCYDSNATHWQTVRHLSLIIPGVSLVVVSGESELTEGETVEMECAGHSDATSILVLFQFNERVVAYCRPFQTVPKLYHESWTIYHRNDSNCILRIAGVKISDSGSYSCEWFLPATYLPLTSNTITLTVKEDPSNTGKIVGPLVVVVIALIACIVLIVLVAVCKKQNRIAKRKMLNNTEHGGGGLDSTTNASSIATDQHKVTTTSLTEKSTESSAHDGDGLYLASTAENAQTTGQKKGKAPKRVNSKTKEI